MLITGDVLARRRRQWSVRLRRLCGDASMTLRALTAQLGQRDIGKRQSARSRVETEISSARLKHLEEHSARANDDAHPIQSEKLVADLDAMLTPEHIVVADASYASIWICNNLDKPTRRHAVPDAARHGGTGLGTAFRARRQACRTQGAGLRAGRRRRFRPCLVGA